jgi:hypothetical protein
MVNKVYRKKRNYKKKKGKSAYRKAVPRTIQIATKRNTNMKLKFVVNQTYVLDPTATGFPVGNCAFLSYRANSVYHSHIPVSTTAGLWASQDPTKYNNLSSAAINQNADGWNEWTERFQHYCVTGSRITATFEPAGSGVPTIMSVHLSGVGGAIQATTNSARINALPYVKKASIVSQGITIPNQAGARLSMNYSARKFEGVTDVDDNSNLRGRFANSLLVPPTTGTSPFEQSFFYVNFTPIDPATAGAMPKGVVRVKVEYIVHLKEPTESNQIQLVTDTADFGAADEL